MVFVKKSAVRAPVEPRASRGMIVSTCGTETTIIIVAQVLNFVGRESALILGGSA